MPYFLVINPESDYEMFNDGNVTECSHNLLRNVVEANSSDDAIYKFASDNIGEPITDPKNLVKYFCIQVGDKKCHTYSRASYNQLLAQKEEADRIAEEEADRKELERLQAKLNARKNLASS